MQTAIKNLIFTVAYGTTMPTQPGDVYHGQQIMPGYTRVGVEQVCQGWETLELDIPLAKAIHGYILWDKRYIVLKSDDQTPRPHLSMPLQDRHLRKTPQGQHCLGKVRRHILHHHHLLRR